MVETALYTCATTSAVISTLNICNFSGSSDVFSVRVCVAGAGDANEQYIFANAVIPANTTVPYTSGITLADTDVIRVVSTNGNCAFQVFGQENS
jgi:hypothetical protein